MKIRFQCTKHNCNVISAEDRLHWIERDGYWFELDDANLYCTGVYDDKDRTEWEHTFIAIVHTDGKQPYTLSDGDTMFEVGG